MNLSKIILIAIGLVVANATQAIAVNVNEITSNPHYFWAIGKGMDLEAANHDALSQIMDQLPRVTVESDVRMNDHTQVVNGKTISSEQSYQAFIRTFTYAYLENCYFDILESGNQNSTGTWEVLRWIDKEEVKRIDERLKNRIIELVDAGRSCERRLQIDDALRNYYQAYVLRQASGMPVSYNLGDGDADLQNTLPLKIKSVLVSIKTNLAGCERRGNRWYADVVFTYIDHPIMSLQVKYKDGRAMRPETMVIRDGHCEFELTELPYDNKLLVQYIYKFAEEALNDPSLKEAYKAVAPLNISSDVYIPLKVKKGEISAKKGGLKGAVSAVIDIKPKYFVQPEEIREVKQRVEWEAVSNATQYRTTMEKVIGAISTGTPRMAKDCFTEDAYALFCQLIKECKPSVLGGKHPEMDFIIANDQVLGRHLTVKLNYPKKKITRKITFRFNPYNGKIQSFGFALTQKAEDDLMNAAVRDWPTLSRFTIMQFMEDYQTAFSLKRINYIESIFNEDALIFTGTMLKKADKKSGQVHLSALALNNDKVKYSRYTKSQYIEKLKKVFKDNSFVDISFEDNISRLLPVSIHGERGTLFGIEIRQIYTSQRYSDTGYLTLVLNTENGVPFIGVRLWQPEKCGMVNIQDFIDLLKF